MRQRDFSKDRLDIKEAIRRNLRGKDKEPPLASTKVAKGGKQNNKKSRMKPRVKDVPRSISNRRFLPNAIAELEHWESRERK